MLTWFEISKSALIHNLKQFRKIIGKKVNPVSPPAGGSNGVNLMAVVKSNAYGHGIIACAKIFEKAGADYLGVINLDEALLLRENGLKKPIFILSYWDIKDIRKISDKISMISDIEFPVYTEEQIKVLAKISQKIGKKAKIHLKIDTGASRIGILPENALNFTLKCLKSPWIEIKGVFTHFAKSEAKNQDFTNKQAQKLIRVKERLMKIRNFPKNALFHAGCTASTLNNPATFFDMVRIGIGLYGLWPSKETKVAHNLRIKTHYGNRIPIVELKPAMSWKTKIIQVKELPKNSFIGYDCTYQCQKKTKIAILPIGYWDGYDRGLSNCGEVLVHGKRAPVRGRICMNLTMVDVSKIPGVKVGDETILLGSKITAEELAEKADTINYEVVTRINPLLPRIYKN